MKIDFLPRGEFVLTTMGGDKVRGKLGFWAWQRFTEKKKIPLADLLEHFEKSLMMDDVVQIILSAIEYTFVKENKVCPYNEIIISDWIDEYGGVSSLGTGWFNRLVEHGFPQEAAEEEKKNQNPPPGEQSPKPVVLQGLNPQSTTIAH